MNILLLVLQKLKILLSLLSILGHLIHLFLPQNNFLEIETKNGLVKVLGPGAIHDNHIPKVNKMPELDEHGTMIRAEFS